MGLKQDYDYYMDKCDRYDFGKKSLDIGGKPVVNNVYHEDDVIDEVITRFITRADKGMIKYNTTMKNNPGDRLYWINHAIEEAMDFVNYLTRLKREFEGNVRST